MAREKKPEEKTGDIPAWFMTYSDVITLLMTFFILLMTFATNEPERFERMQISLFGGAGATGVAGASESNEFDALLLRERPRSARTSMRGSETPPVKADPGMSALAKGLEGLDGPQEFDPQRSFAVSMSIANLFDLEGNLTSEAKQHLFTAAKRVEGGNMRAAIRGAPNELDRCIRIAEFMVQAGGLQPSLVGVGAWLNPEASGKLRLELQQMGDKSNG